MVLTSYCPFIVVTALCLVFEGKTQEGQYFFFFISPNVLHVVVAQYIFNSWISELGEEIYKAKVTLRTKGSETD